MGKRITTEEEAAELKQLRLEHAAALKHAGKVLAAKGMDSPEFAEADKAAETINHRICEILGTAASDQIQ
jgi:hypothetical protein